MYSLLALVLLSMCHGTSTSLNYQHKDIVTKLKVELSPVQITCAPNDLLILATPLVNREEVLYHLHKPNGEVLRTNFSGPLSKVARFHGTSYGDDKIEQKVMVLKYINKNVKIVYPTKMYKIINIYSTGYNLEDTIRNEEELMNRNDFMVGPLLEEDHGNWVLSVYCRDNGEWIEMFQVITVTLITSVPMAHSKVTITEGSTFNLSFLYPINGLETCELTVPSRLPDRFFDRSRIELDKCGYSVPNVTKHDQGYWTVIGVGRIVYEGIAFLEVVDKTKYHRLQYKKLLFEDIASRGGEYKKR